VPYYITDKSADCPAWSVIKESGEVLACHDTKESAIEQAIAVSIAEDTEFVGERAAVGELKIGDWVTWNIRNPKVLALIVLIEGELAGLEVYELEDEVYHSTSRLMIMNVFKLQRIPMPEKISAEIEDAEEQDVEKENLEDEGEANLPDNYRPALSPDVPEGRACGNCFFYDETRLNDDGDKAWCERWDAFVDGGNYCNAWQPAEENSEARAVDLTPPAYMRAAARRGLEYYAEGLAGDGLVDRTVREARAMAEGNVTADKWVRIAAWIARHLGDLDSPDANPSSENYPSAGVVAHLLWGSGPSKASANRAMKYAQGVVARLEEENRATISQESEQMAKIEKRTNEVTFELRAVEGGDGMTFTGYAAVFNSPSEPLPFIERIAPGAFKRSLKARNDIKLLYNHDTGAVLGSTRAGTLKLEEDNYGLRVTAVLPETTLGKDVRTLVQRGDVSAMSFGFSVPANGDSWNTDGTERTLRSVRIHEVSIVAFPAYQQTAGTATVRSFDGVAKRTEVDADQLADAFLAIEDGKDLSLEQSELLTKVIQRLTPQEEAEAEDNSGELTALELKKKKFELLMKRL
jgi:HK97 family phage prohead protease